MINKTDVRTTATFAAFLAVAVPDALWAASPEDVEQFYDENSISIATGRSMPINIAPAVATVITAEELEAIGATTLSEALTLVPGVNVTYRSQGDLYVIRGIQSDSNFNPEVTILIDGVPQNDVHFGNARKFTSQIPWQNIARIEVIRGPGSAIYGADAFAGVINIVTKRPSEVHGVELGIRGGSFDTGELRGTVKNEIGDTTSVLSVQARTTDGHEPWIEEDAQTYWDQIFGTNASLAPGNMQTWVDDYNLMWDLRRDKWQLRLRNAGRTMGITGIVGALDDQGKTESQYYSADLRFHDPRFSDNWTVSWDTGYLRYEILAKDTHAFPAGAFGGAFPEGVLDDPGYTEDRTRTELSGVYSGFSKHVLRIGTGGEYARVYDMTEARNFTYSPFGMPIPTGTYEALSEDEMFSQEKDRTVLFAYVQDEWTLAQDWALTTGIRYDNYSDFGSTINPRVALVWTTRQDLTTKLLAGKAFRAPTLLDLYAQNTPSIIGNPDVEPVEIQTYELAFDYRPTSKLRTGLGFFYHDISNQIGVTTTPLGSLVDNVEGQTGNGFEVDFRWEMSTSMTLRGYYAHQKNELKEIHVSPGNAPENSANLRFDWRFMPAWYFNTNMRWVADRPREPGDSREPIDDYLWFDVTLRYKPANQNWNLGITVNNVFDADARDPVPETDMPNDLPLPERAIYAHVRTFWD